MLGDIFGFIAVFLLGWLGIGSGLVYLINILQFQIPFSRTMVQEGIYDRPTHKNVLLTKWIGALVTLGISTGLAVWMDLRAGTMGLVMTVLGILVGFLRSRHILGRGTNNVCRFMRTHSICMNREKAAAFLRREYDLDFDRLVPREKP